MPTMLYTDGTMKHELKPVPFHFLFLPQREREEERERGRKRERERERERERGERKGERGHRWIISRSEVHRQEPPCWPPSIALHTNDELRISILREKGMKHERRASSVSEPGRESGCVYVRACEREKERERETNNEGGG